MPEEFAGHGQLRAVRMSGCFTLMIGCTADPDIGFQAARVTHPVLSWIAVNASKPGFSLVVHSRNDWADANLELGGEHVRQAMLAAFMELTGRDLGQAAWLDLHRWRYASVEQAADRPFLLDAGHGLAACGDWCISNRVEAAYESARRLAEALRLLMAR
eukprot:gene48551-biopygen33913